MDGLKQISIHVIMKIKTNNVRHALEEFFFIQALAEWYFEVTSTMNAHVIDQSHGLFIAITQMGR